MAKRVIVEAVGIKNILTGPDPGDDLEIYGHLGAWVVFTNSSGRPQARIEQLLMNKPNPDSRQSITQGSTLHIGRETPVLTIGDNEELWVGGHLKEQDGPSANDSLGDRHNKIPHGVLLGGQQLVHFFDEGQVVAAIFEIKMV